MEISEIRIYDHHGLPTTCTKLKESSTFHASLANKRYQAHLAGFSLPKGRKRYNQTGLMSLMAQFQANALRGVLVKAHWDGQSQWQ